MCAEIWRRTDLNDLDNLAAPWLSISRCQKYTVILSAETLHVMHKFRNLDFSKKV